MKTRFFLHYNLTLNISSVCKTPSQIYTYRCVRSPQHFLQTRSCHANPQDTWLTPGVKLSYLSFRWMERKERETGEKDKLGHSRGRKCGASKFDGQEKIYQTCRKHVIGPVGCCRNKHQPSPSVTQLITSTTIMQTFFSLKFYPCSA